MSGHNHNFDAGNALQGGALLADPGTTGTVNLKGRSHCVARGFGAGTYVLPNVSEKQIGTVVYVVADGSQTWTNVLGSTVATLASGQTGMFIATTTTTWVASAANAASIAILDAAGYTTATTVEGALASLLEDAGRIEVPVSSFVLASDGTPAVKWADGSADGLSIANSEAYGYRWNPSGTPAAVMFTVPLPPDAIGKVLTANVLASKIGATVGDATTFTFTAYAQDTGSLHDAAANIGGVTSAMTGNATSKTVQHETVAFTTLEEGLSGPLPVTGPASLTCTVKPTNSTLGTDDVIIHRLWFTYPK